MQPIGGHYFSGPPIGDQFDDFIQSQHEFTGKRIGQVTSELSSQNLTICSMSSEKRTTIDVVDEIISQMVIPPMVNYLFCVICRKEIMTWLDTPYIKILAVPT